MEKAHLYEALYLVNHGIDEAVRGVQRLINDEISQLMRVVERERKLEGKPPLVEFLPRRNRPKKTQKKEKKAEGVSTGRKPNGPLASVAAAESQTQEHAHE